jgi:hypothetical protein
VRGLAFRQQRAVFRAAQFITKVDHRVAYIQQLRPHQNLFVIARRGAVAAFGLGHGDEASILALHVTIGKAQLPQQFDASHLEPDEMVGVINHSHLIGLGVTHAQPGFIDRLWVIRVHFPVHTGLRFSRNDTMPSRKSAVVRIAAFSRTAASI